VIASMSFACERSCGDDAPRWYRAVIKGSEGESAFFLQLPPKSTGGEARVLNGTESISVNHRWLGDNSLVFFDLYDSTIDSTIQRDNSLDGKWLVGYHDSALPFHATPIPSPDPTLRYPGHPPLADVGGNWDLGVEGSSLRKKATFQQTPEGVVTGTVLRERNTDFRFLAGNLVGRELFMSTFDGCHALLLRARIDPDRGELLRGRLVSLAAPTEAFTFTASRSSDLQVSRSGRVRLDAGRSTISIPELRRAPYAGKPVLVDIFGTWCPACMDMVPLLKELYAKHHRAGLEILGIAYELTDESTVAQRRIEIYQRRFNPTWEIVARPGNPETLAERLPPELSEVEGLPLTLFIRRDGSLFEIHEGFAGPATGPEYLRDRAAFERLVEEIVAP
jgi:thiol-disulfide isomerase/thioredoxin